jgi:hypothetical protein
MAGGPPASRPAPPSGSPPPTRALTAGGEAVDLVAIADEVCTRYQEEFPDERQRYGPAGDAWCRHDNQYLLAWAIQDARDGTVDLAEQACWLASVLRARGFPVTRLARDLDLAADLAPPRIPDAALARKVGDCLRAAAAAVRAFTA